MAIFYVESGPNRGERIRLSSGTFTVGRTGQHDVMLLDVSGPILHGTLICAEDRTVFSDCTEGRCSSRGGLPIQGDVELRPGDRIKLGETVWVLESHGAVVYAIDTEEIMRVEEPAAEYGDDDREQRDPKDQPSNGKFARFSRVPENVEIVAESPSMRRAVELALRVAATSSTVLVCGESGTGKEVIARAIALNGPRALRPFVSVNAAALSEGLLESELFGHERGAFTGAIALKRGMFEVAHTGTLFLDEIGEISPSMQSKLLRILESRELRRVGGTETRRVDVRLICATNRNLRALVRENKFREDLFFRIAVVELQLPPLRDRQSDLEPLCDRILRTLAKERGIARPKLDALAIEKLRAYHFPGNVRELRNLLERALIFADEPIIRAGDIAISARATRSHADSLSDFPSLQSVERNHIELALRVTSWNKKRAAEILQVDRKTLYAKIDFFGLRPPGDLPDPAGDAANGE